MPQQPPARTYFADQAVQLADLLQLKFSTQKFGTTVQRVLKVLEPDGPSTDGGRRARQSIMLTPVHDEDGHHAIFCGWLDGSRRTAELKSYAVIADTFRSRFSKELDISKGEYERLIELMSEFLRTQAIDFRLNQTPARRVAPASAPWSDSSQARQMEEEASLHWGLVLMIGFIFGFVLCYLLFVF